METLANKIKKYVDHCLARCRQCANCLAICPVMHPEEGIEDLNQVGIGALNYHTDLSLKDHDIHKGFVKFIKECIQCGKCRNDCPASNFRDVMVLWQKYQLKDTPPVTTDHFQYRGGVQPFIKNIGINLFNIFKGVGMKELSKHVDKTELRQCDTLFYFGCYIFSPTKLPAKTLKLANHLGMDYEVIGGLRSCCGWPQYLAGDFERAEELFEDLYALIKKVNPKQIITGCAECYAAIWRLKNTKEESYEPLTTSQWLSKNMDKLGLSKEQEKITFHDACHLVRKIGNNEEARTVLNEMANLVEMEQNRKQSLCCGYYQFNINPPQVESLRAKKLVMAKATGAEKMAVECVTCLESYQPLAKKMGIEVVDVVDMVYERVFQG